MAKKRNRLRDVLEEKGYKQSQVADLCGIKRDRFRKIVGNHVEIIGWELTTIADILECEERSLYEPDQIDVKTFTEHEDDLAFDNLSVGRWQAALVAEDEESCFWLRQGYKQQENIDITPAYVRVGLNEGRILLGRAVEHIGSLPEDEENKGVLSNQIISVIRDGHDEDRKLSRFQLDLTFSGDRGLVALYVQSKKVAVILQGRRQELPKGTCVYLQNNDKIELPNKKTLRLECHRL